MELPPPHHHHVLRGPHGQVTPERLPKWSHAETKELLAVRAQLDRNFSASKRNKLLWQAVSDILFHRGFRRTPDQCRSKWKNLLTRFKGISEGSGDQIMNRTSFPFGEEMRKIFRERSGVAQLVQLDRESEEEAEKKSATRKRRKREKDNLGRMAVEGVVKEFMRRQAGTDALWLKAAQAREAERRAEEAAWRRAMEELQAERMQRERQWRQLEEARREKEAARAELRHGLLMQLLQKLMNSR
ncbi:trihelix transcription factor GT-3b-like [Curcuma longa]|uniref:trihelix transcription factor GT-3b-like n=1 Tax=Curcuma longa TaxID=136217 RepID=UPI003D9ED32C